MEIITRQEEKEKGLMYYYTGKPCKYGHISKRYTSTYTCKICHTINFRKIDPENKEELENAIELSKLKRHKITKEIEEKILKLYKDGISAEAIGRKLELGATTVRRYLDANKIKKRGVKEAKGGYQMKRNWRLKNYMKLV